MTQGTAESHAIAAEEPGLNGDLPGEFRFGKKILSLRRNFFPR
jgi:hypothetical protein